MSLHSDSDTTPHHMEKYDWDALLPEAKNLRDEGLSFPQIGDVLGVPASAVRYQLNCKSFRPSGGLSRDAEIASLKAQIPTDEKSLRPRTQAQVLMGEPVFERSALYKQQQQERA